jgi:dATP pyrophosphohydrolase
MSNIHYVDVFPFAYDKDELKYLLLRRSADNSYPGIWQPVAGKVRQGELAWQAGLRELAEETGLAPLNFYALDHLSSYYLHRFDRIIHVPAFMAEVAFTPPQLSKEHDKYQWLPFEAAITSASWNPYRKAIDCISKLLASSPALALAKIELKK